MLIRRILSHTTKIRPNSFARIATSLNKPFLSVHPLLHTSMRHSHGSFLDSDIADGGIFDNDLAVDQKREHLIASLDSWPSAYENLEKLAKEQQLKPLINTFHWLAAATAKFKNDNDKIALFEKLGTNHVFNLIKEQPSLAQTLSHLRFKEPLVFIEFLGEDNLKELNIIKDIGSLLGQLGKNKELLLDSLDTELLKANLNGRLLKDILSQIDKQEHYKLLARLGKDFFVIDKIQDSNQVVMCLGLLSEQNQKVFLNLLGSDVLIKIVKSSIDLGTILNNLHKNNHAHLLSLLEVHAKNLCKIIQFKFGLLSVLDKLNVSDHGKLLKLLGDDKLSKLNFNTDDRAKMNSKFFPRQNKASSKESEPDNSPANNFQM